MNDGIDREGSQWALETGWLNCQSKLGCVWLLVSVTEPREAKRVSHLLSTWAAAVVLREVCCAGCVAHTPSPSPVLSAVFPVAVHIFQGEFLVSSKSQRIIPVHKA